MSTRKSRSKKSAQPAVPVAQATPNTNSPASVASGSAEEEDGACNQSPRHGRKQSEQKRRVLMNQYFDEVVMLLSLISEKSIPKRLDKVSTLKEAVSCMKIYHDLTISKSEDMVVGDSASTVADKSLSSPVPVPTSVASSASSQDASPGVKELRHLLKTQDILKFFLDSYDAFLMVVSETGRIIFTTEMVTSLLGHMQSRLVGQNLLDFVHNRDHPTIRGLFTPAENVQGISILDSHVLVYPSVSFTALLQLYVGETSCFPQYLPFKCVSFLRRWKPVRNPQDLCPPSPLSQDGSEGLVGSLGGERGESDHQSFIILIGKLPTSLALLDLTIGTNDVNFEFEMRVSREGRIVDIDKHAILVMGFSITELLGTLFFEYIDPYHVTDVGESLGRFLSTGLGSTTPYRIRTKGGRYIWIISKGYLSYNPWNNKPDHILLSNQVLGCDQVLPEHRFFRNRQHLPDLDGQEQYIPSLNESSTSTNAQPAEPATPNMAANPMSVHSQVSMDTAEQDRPQSAFGRQENVSNGGRTLQDTLYMSSVFVGPSTGRRDSGANPDSRQVGGHLGGGEGVGESMMAGREMAPVDGARDSMGVRSQRASVSNLSQQEDDQGSNLEVIPGATAIAHKMIQKELEEKTQQLELMQQQLREKEDKFKREQLEFYRFMQQMMQQIPNSVSHPYHTPSTTPTTSAIPPFPKDKLSLMDFMQSARHSDQGGGGGGGGQGATMASMMSSLNDGSSVGRGVAPSREDHMMGEWQGSQLEMGQYQQMERDSNTMLHSYPSRSNTATSISSPPLVAPPNSAYQRHNNQGHFTPNSIPSPASSTNNSAFNNSELAFSSADFPNPAALSTTRDAAMYPAASQQGGTAMEQSRSFSRPPGYHPGNPSKRISLADHNMKFYQQQQNQQQQQQQQLVHGWNNSSDYPPNSRSSAARPSSIQFSSEGSISRNMTEGDLANLLFSPSLPP